MENVLELTRYEYWILSLLRINLSFFCHQCLIGGQGTVDNHIWIDRLAGPKALGLNHFKQTTP